LQRKEIISSEKKEKVGSATYQCSNITVLHKTQRKRESTDIRWIVGTVESDVNLTMFPMMAILISV